MEKLCPGFSLVVKQDFFHDTRFRAFGRVQKTPRSPQMCMRISLLRFPPSTVLLCITRF